MRSFRNSTAALLAVAASVLAGCAVEQTFNGTLVEPPIEAPELAGTNWDGHPFSLSDQRGRVAILFFGYTYCPDVCPLTLAKMKQLYEALGDRAQEVAVVFVSVDPRRDTVQKLASYVPNFDERFFGVHVELDELEAAKDALGLAIQYGQPKDGPGTDSFYYVDHTGSYFVVDREGLVRLRYSPTATPDLMLPDLQAMLGDSPSGIATRVPELEIQGAWAQILPGVGAVYLTVVNSGSEPDRLIAVETPAAAGAMLHATVQENEMMRMVGHENGFEVPAGGTLELAPGGRHVMLMEPLLDSAEQQTIQVTLRFARAGAIELLVPVRFAGD